MNNNRLPISQNMGNSGIELPYQFAQNLNYFFYIMPDKSQILIPSLNYYPFLPMSYVQNTSQPLLMNLNQDNNEAPILYNYNYNNINNPLNTFGFGGPIIPPQNTQLNYEQSSPAPISKDLSFLNKKRNNTTANKKEKDKEKEQNNNRVKKNEEENKNLNGSVKITGKENLENNETKIISDEENIIKEIKSGEKEEIKKEIKENENKKNSENEKENIMPSSTSASAPPNEDKKDKDINNVEKKKGKKKKKNYAELLHDTILEHIGEPKKKVISTIENDPLDLELKNNKYKTDIKNKNKNKTGNKDKNISNTPTENNNIELDETLENTEIKDKDKNKKLKIKNQRSQKKKQHKITIKNNKDILADLDKDKNDNNEINPKLTKVIFHGENYEKTKSTIDFMKYNFDFRLEEQYKTKKLITDYDQQHIDLTRINQKLYENYNSNSQNLNEIEQKWSRKKFVGDNKDLKKVISIIKDSFPGRKLDVNEEKCLNILKNNDYNIEEFLDSRHGK